MKHKTTIKSFSLLAGITIFEKIIAFVFEAVIAAMLGASIITDGYFTAAELFTLIDAAFVSGLTVVALNRFTLHVKTENETRGFEVLSELQSFYLPLMLLLSVLIFSLARPLSFVVAPGYSEEARQVVVRCIHVMAPVPFIVCITAIGMAVLRQKKAFAVTGLKSLFISVVGIASVLLFGRGQVKNADLLSIAYVISIASYCILISFMVRKYGRIRLHRPVFTQDLQATLKMILPLMASYGIGRMALMVDKIVASTLAEGSVSCLTYAHSLYKVVCAIFITNLSTIILTDFNDYCAQKNYEKVKESIQRIISTMTLLLIPITIVTLFNSNEIAHIVYQRGNFTQESTALVGSVLVFYALNFIPAMVQSVYNQVFYAFGDTVSPMWMALLNVVLNLGLSIPLMMALGLPGVAIGTLCSTLITVQIKRAILRKHLKNYTFAYTKLFLLKTLPAVIACLAVTVVIVLLVHNPLLSFALSVLSAFCVFFLVLFLLKEEICVSYYQTIMKKIRKNKRQGQAV